MFEDLRKHSSWIVIVIAAVFILSMAIGGITSAFIKKPFVASIGGEKITPQEYQQYIERSFANYAQANPGQEIDDKTAAQLREETWKQVVDEVLIGQALKENRIKISDKEVVEKLKNPDAEIRSIEQFQIDGEFDQATYIDYLTQDERFATILEEQIRSTLPIQKLYDKIKSEVKVTEEDVRADYVEKNNQADAKIIYFNSNKVKDVEVSEAEIAEYYENNKEDYKKGPARKLRYVNMKITPSEADKQAAQQRAEEIYKEALQEEDFAQLAREKSQGPSADKGGDLGYFTKDRMVPAFAEKAFAMKVGEISEPVQTQFGWHVIKVNDTRTNENGQKEVKASHILINEEPSIETQIAFEQRAKDLHAAAKKDGVAKAAEDFAEKAEETRDFYEDATFISGLGREQELIDFAFKNKEGKVADLIENEAAFIIAEVSHHVGDHYQPLEDVTSSIERLVKREKQLAEVQKRAEKFVAEHSPKDYFTAAKAADWEVIEQKNLTAVSNIDKVGKDEELNKAILALDGDEYTDLIKTEKAAYLALVEKRQKPDMEKFNQDLERLTEEYRESKENEHLNEWYRNLREDAEIIDNRDEFFN
ncbi:MAG: peptidylprolyl isomerase [Candidatus Cloacimonadales bacterium]